MKSFTFWNFSLSPGEETLSGKIKTANLAEKNIFKFYILELFRKSGEDFSLQNIFQKVFEMKYILEREIFSRFPEKFQNVKFEIEKR